MKRIGIAVLVAVAAVVAFSATASAEEIMPIEGFEVVEDFPGQIMAGSAYEAHYRFNCTANEPIPVTMHFGVGGPDIGLNEWFVNATVNGGSIDVIENEENAGNFILSCEVAAGSKNDVIIQISSLPNVLPAAYTFTMELWSGTVKVVPRYVPGMAALTVDTTPVRGEVFVDGSSWGTAPQSRSVDAGTYTVSFGDVPGYETPASETVTLAAGETKTVTGIYTGIPTPAEFEPSNLVIGPAEVGIGGTVTISIGVTNIGGTAGTCSVTLTINGIAVDTKDITLAEGATGTITFTVTEEVTGDYAVDVNGLTGTFVVTAPPSMVPLAVTGIVAVLLAGILIWLRKRREEEEEEEEDST